MLERATHRPPRQQGAAGRLRAGAWPTTAISSRPSTCSAQAHSPEDPDWRILSAQGAALDQLGRYDEARQYYASALRIAPDEPTVLSNLGLSYVLSKDLPKAEDVFASRLWPCRVRSARTGQPRRRRRPPGPHDRGRDSDEGWPAGRAGATRTSPNSSGCCREPRARNGAWKNCRLRAAPRPTDVRLSAESIPRRRRCPRPNFESTFTRTSFGPQPPQQRRQ